MEAKGLSIIALLLSINEIEWIIEAMTH